MESQIADRKYQMSNKGRPRGIPCHIGLPDTVASFRTWRGFRVPIARPPKACSIKRASRLNGESGIRTHGGVTPTHAFQACSLNHSDISPQNLSTVPQAMSFGDACLFLAAERRKSVATAERSWSIFRERRGAAARRKNLSPLPRLKCLWCLNPRPDGRG
jgi:hypothetical protein